jgi:hypothetical protein
MARAPSALVSGSSERVSKGSFLHINTLLQVVATSFLLVDSSAIAVARMSVWMSRHILPRRCAWFPHPQYVTTVHARRGICGATNNVLHPGAERPRLYGLMAQGRRLDACPAFTWHLGKLDTRPGGCIGRACRSSSEAGRRV